MPDGHHFLMSLQFCVDSPKVVVFGSFLAIDFSNCAKINSVKSKGRAFPLRVLASVVGKKSDTCR